ncbi:GMC oxidoreductase [Cercophora newfieldiana]|uniref:GMC oxidoreductase n=1 Tax=Cercophora newfieldiana TaxID=92897 RepID=A0AA39YJM5_9PEZI|nr:GMC oxidoreductase [Cercophora newfieldiana]
MVPKTWTLLLTTAAVVAAKEYDYIIVGGGTAGLALATRLSTSLPESPILVIEAGPAAAVDELRITVPGFRGSGLGSIYDWNFTTTAQPHIANRTIDVNRGKVLGGSSALNYLCYDRAAAAEYDAWGSLINNTDRWNWDVMLSAMLKSENFTGEDGDKHGRTGPIRTTYNRKVPEFLSTWKPSLNKLGVPINDGASLGGKPVGVMYQPTNINPNPEPGRWTRSNSATDYLPLAGSNLEVRTNTRVAKVDFIPGSQPLLASGVVLEDGTKITARKEVILSAGAVQSPGLLELSGIGQPAVLNAANITVLRALPGVGENYQDHIRLSNVYRLKDNYSSFDPMIYDNTGSIATEQLRLWLAGKPSWYDYTSTAYAFLNWDLINTTTQSTLAHLASHPSPTHAVDIQKSKFLTDPSVPQLEIIMESNFVGATPYPGTGNFVTLISSVMHPLSRGSVHISNSSIHSPPLINPSYLSHPYDIQALIAGAKYARRIAHTKPLSDIWTQEVEPGQKIETDAEWEAFARSAMGSFFHPVGTCAMLPEKEGGVVDAELKVYGTSNVRVVDCSVIPVLLSAHIQTAAYGIAEVAAGVIAGRA